MKEILANPFQERLKSLLLGKLFLIEERNKW